MTIYYGPQLDAELAYRRERIAHDFQVASGWRKAARRARGRLLAFTHPASTRSDRALAAS